MGPSNALALALRRFRRGALLALALPAPFGILHGCGSHPSATGSGAGAAATASSTTAAGGAGGGCGAHCTDAGQGGSSPGEDFKCFAADAPLSPSACPAAAGAGSVNFCYRAQWAGVTTVEVFGGFGQASDWKTPFLTLTNDGTGTFTGSAKIANGSYPYMFRIQGGADGYVIKNQYLLDARNPSFVDSPPGSPTYAAGSTVPRACSSVTVPQVDAPTYQVKGQVKYGGKPQPCYKVKLEVGELVVGGAAKREHNTATFTETAADGSFTFEAAAGLVGGSVEFPFNLVSTDGGYPNPLTYRAAAVAVPTMFTVAADTTVPAVDMIYPDYAVMMPVGQGGTLPVTFKYTLIPGAATASLTADKTNIPGNDPGFASPQSAMTSYTWNGVFGGAAMDKVMPGTQYYWGTFQKMAPAGGTTWTVESMLFPITFQ